MVCWKSLLPKSTAPPPHPCQPPPPPSIDVLSRDDSPLPVATPMISAVSMFNDARVHHANRLGFLVAEAPYSESAPVAAAPANIRVLGIVAELGDAAHDDGVHAQKSCLTSPLRLCWRGRYWKNSVPPGSCPWPCARSPSKCRLSPNFAPPGPKCLCPRPRWFRKVQPNCWPPWHSRNRTPQRASCVLAGRFQPPPSAQRLATPEKLPTRVPLRELFSQSSSFVAMSTGVAPR